MKKILIVEDERALREILEKKFFQEKDFEVVSAKNGEDGLNLALKEKPDLILLDIVMPKMDGMTMLHILRGNEWGKNVPVILLSNLNDASKISDGVNEKVFDYLVKSDWHIDDVVKKVREKLGD